MYNVCARKSIRHRDTGPCRHVQGRTSSLEPASGEGLPGRAVVSGGRLAYLLLIPDI